jgi:hypothetical protein
LVPDELSSSPFTTTVCVTTCHRAKNPGVIGRFGLCPDAALDHARQALALDREFWIGYMMRAQAHEQRGESDLALAALADGARFSGNAINAELPSQHGRPSFQGTEGSGGRRFNTKPQSHGDLRSSRSSLSSPWLRVSALNRLPPGSPSLVFP